MPKIKSMSATGKKWAEKAAASSGEYELGVRNPKIDWAAATAGAVDSYKAGITASLTNDSYKKGVQRAGTAAWQKGAIEKGTARFGPGVQVAQPDYEKGFAPFHKAIESTTLPTRYARRDPRNIERVRVMNIAMAAVKTGQGK